MSSTRLPEETPPPYSDAAGAPPPTYQQPQRPQEGLQAVVVDARLPPVDAGGELEDVGTTEEAIGDAPFTRHVILSCVVFWLCGFVFGFIAYVLAITAQNLIQTNRKKAKRHGIASLILSALGLAAGAVVLVVVLAITRGLSESRGPPVCSGLNVYTSDGTDCFLYRWYQYEYSYYNDACLGSEPGTTHSQYSQCYSNCSAGLFSANGRCHRNRTYMFHYDLDDNDTCMSLYDGGSYCSSNRFCYHNCTAGLYSVDNECFRHKSPAYDSSCLTTTNSPLIRDDSRYCYYNCSGDLFMAPDFNCYRYVTYNYGFYNNLCYSNYSSYGPTYYADSRCYHNCTSGLYQGGEQCYMSRTTSCRSAQCCRQLANNNNIAYYNGSHCFYNCSNSQYLVGDQCFSYRDLVNYDFTCESMLYGITLYVFPYCYHHCPLFTTTAGCFNYRRRGACLSWFLYENYTFYDGAYCYLVYAPAYCSGSEASYAASDRCFVHRANANSSTYCALLANGRSFFHDSSLSYCYYDERRACSTFTYAVGKGCFNRVAAGFTSATSCYNGFSSSSNSDTYFDAENKICYNNG